MMSIRKVSCHSKTLLHRNLTQERLFYKKGYFLKPTRETTNVLTIKVIHYFSSWNLLEAVIWRCSQIFTKFTAKNLCLQPATLLKKRLCYRCLISMKLLRTPLLIEHLHLWLFLLSWSFLHFTIDWWDYKKFTKLVPSDFFLEFTKLNPKAVAQMCSIKKLFQVISENSLKNICARESPF